MKIEKGTKNGLPHFLELWYYHNDVIEKFIQIGYVEFCETPDGTRCFEKELPVIIIKDTPGVLAVMDGETEITPAIPAGTKYTDYCTQFGNDNIIGAINAHLQAL